MFHLNVCNLELVPLPELHTDFLRKQFLLTSKLLPLRIKFFSFCFPFLSFYKQNPPTRGGRMLENRTLETARLIWSKPYSSTSAPRANANIFKVVLHNFKRPSFYARIIYNLCIQHFHYIIIFDKKQHQKKPPKILEAFR